MTDVVSWVTSHAWGSVGIAYSVIAGATFLPVLQALLRTVKLNEGGASFDDSPHFSVEAKVRLDQHFTRLKGTLAFWKNQAAKHHRFHIYTLCWTIPASVFIPLLAQTSAPGWMITLVSTHTAVLLAFHRGFRVEGNYRAFRHGESEFYDLYRRFLDDPSAFGRSEDARLRRYFSETESVRRYVRAAETGNLPSLDDSRSRGRSAPDSHETHREDQEQ